MTTETQKVVTTETKTVGNKMKEAIADKTTTCIIEKALNKDNKTLLKLIYGETFNLKKVRYLCGLEVEEFVSKFWDPDELQQSGEKWDMDKYVKNVRKGLNDILKKARKDGVTDDFITIERKYKRTGKGRLFVIGFGLQSCQNKLRKFLSGDTSYDIDLVKCHYQIIDKLCDIHEIPCNRIKQFLKDPHEIVQKEGIGKQQMLMMLYLDNYKGQSDLVNKIHKQKCLIFDELMDTPHFKSLEFEPSEKSKKDKNTISSVIAQYLQHLECEILIAVLNEYPDDIEVLMFDGFQPKITVDVDAMLKKLQVLTGFEWSQKDNIYDIPGWAEEELCDYITWAEEFEKNSFAINEPERSYAVNYEICKFLLSPNKLLDRFPEQIDMIKDWIADEGKLVYDRFVYKPYGALSEDPTPSNEYNTWKPYERPILNKIITEEEVSWFNKLLEESLVNYNNLNEPDDECRKGSDWLKNWMARFIQFPDENMGVYPVLFGKQGGGKDTLALIIGKLIGKERVLQTSNIEDVIGEGFNSMLEGKQFILLNESGSTDVIKVNGHIKAHVTAEELVIRTKYQPDKTIKNYSNIAFASNDIFPMAEDCRRSIGFQTRNWRGADKVKSPEFFGEIYACMENESKLNELWTYFNQRDVKDWKARNNLYDTHLSKQIKLNNTPDWIKFCWYLVDNKFQFTNDENTCVSWDGVKAFKKTYEDWKYEEKGTRDFNYNVTKKQLMATDCWFEGRKNKCRFIKLYLDKLDSYLQINNPRDSDSL